MCSGAGTDPETFSIILIPTIRYYCVTPKYCMMRGIWIAKESVCSIMLEAQLSSSILGVEVCPFTQALSTSIRHIYVYMARTDRVAVGVPICQELSAQFTKCGRFLQQKAS